MPAARRLLLAATLLFIPCAALAAPLLDADYLGLPVGFNPSLLASGDLTGDGVDDLVVGDASGVACLVALGDGEFAPLVRVDARIASAFAIAELTGDGVADIAVTGRDEAEVRIHPGHGDGTFDPPNVLPFRSGSTGLLARDLDGDGSVDLVGSDPGSRSIWTWFLRHSGGFAAPIVTAANVPPGRLLAGDLDGDGASDLFVLHANAQAGFTLMRNDGLGAFGPPILYDGPGGSQTGATGDFDGDGVPDVAIPRSYTYPEVYAVAVWSGRSDGTFAGPVIVPTLGLAVGTAVADLESDGRDDLVLAAELGGQWVNPGSATGLGTARDLGRPMQASPPIVCGQFDADGRPDLASAEHTQTGGGLGLPCAFYRASSVFVWRGNGAGGFAGSRLQPLAGLGVVRVAARDIDGDGLVDLVANRSGSVSATMIERGLGDGTFEEPVVTPDMPLVRDFKLVDVEGDGRAEVALLGSRALIVYDVDPALRLVERFRHALGSNSTTFAANDFDGDGHLDFAILHRTFPSAIQIVLAGADTSYSTLKLIQSVFPPVSIASADFNGDGLGDLFVGVDGNFQGAPSLYQYRAVGDGWFAPSDSMDTGLTPVALAVLDRGPREDLEVLAGIGGLNCSDEHAGVLVLRVVEGVFARVQGPLFLGGKARTLEVADLDGDRIPDIVAAGDRGRLGFRPGLPDGTFGERRDFGVTNGIATAAIADFDEDGRLDVAAATVGGVAILLNRGGAVPVAPAVIARLGAGGADALLHFGDTRPFPLVIAGTDAVDVRTIDPVSVRLAGAPAIRGRVLLNDGIEESPPSFDGCTQVVDGGDGRADLEVVFRADEVLDGWLRTGAPSHGADESARVAALPFTARRLDGTTIAGTACAVIVGHPDEEEGASSVTMRAFGLAPGFESGVGVVLTLPAPIARADVAVFDLAGRRLAVLERGPLGAGVHRLTWSSRAGGAGTRPAAGIYFVRADLDGKRLNGRILVTR